MPWEKQFDVDRAVGRVRDAFWEYGYEATSMEALLRRMGINRGSFYDTFGSKHEVLLQALARYSDENRRAALQGALTASAGDPLRTIFKVFESMIDGSRGPQGRHGCLLVNCALELAPRDADVARVVRDGFADTERFFRTLLEQAQASGRLRPEVDTGGLAVTLNNQLNGLMVMVRAGVDAPRLRTVVDQVARMIESSR